MIRGEELELAGVEISKIKANIEDYLKSGALRKILRKYIKVMTFDQGGFFGKSKKYKNDILLNAMLEKELDIFETELELIMDNGLKGRLPGVIPSIHAILSKEYVYRVKCLERSLYNKIRKYHLQVSDQKRKNHPELLKAKESVLKLIAYEAYAESSPQAILQFYTLWKRPWTCISLETTKGWISSGK